jgi:hypothetical protein
LIYSSIQNKTIYKYGKIDPNIFKTIPLNKNAFNGFFSGCQPSYCAYRITYYQNNQWKIVDDEDKLKKFLGIIDNQYEAFIIAEINDYSIDPTNSKGNGFEKVNYGYKLKVMKYNSCPESKESIMVDVDKKGTLRQLKSLGFYLKSKNCIVY